MYVQVTCSRNVAKVCAFIEKNRTAIVRIVRTRSFIVLIETVHRSTGTKPELFLTSTVNFYNEM